MMFISYRGLGNTNKSKVLWKLACLALMWVVPRKRYARIFWYKASSLGDLWDIIYFLTSFWTSCATTFRDVTLNLIQLDWMSMCSSNGVG